MPNGNDRRPPWGEYAYRTVLMLMLGAILTALINLVGSNEGLRATLTAHTTRHPDVGLTLRLNALERQMQMSHSDLERRVRLMEIRLGSYDE